MISYINKPYAYIIDTILFKLLNKHEKVTLCENTHIFIRISYSVIYFNLK